MATPPEGTERRHGREKTTIDHLVQDVYEPKAPDQEHAIHSPSTSTGLPIEDQVSKEWDLATVAFLPFVGRGARTTLPTPRAHQ
jgi:hypothetical protein